MAGINSISDIYKKHGAESLEKLLSNPIRITEKYDAHRFSFEKTKNGFIFFGKNSASPLTRIDRTVSDLYESAIQHIENLPEDIASSLPRGQRFGFYFFPSNSPGKTSYDKTPKNGLVLTDVTIRRGNKITESITSYPILKRYSNLFITDCDKPLYEGNLDGDYIQSIIETAKSSDDVSQLFERTSTDDFLRNDGNKIMEGVIFQCSTDQGPFLMKHDSIVNETIERKREQLFDILLLNIYEFLETYKLPNVVNESRTDERYLAIIFEMFNEYVRRYGKQYLELGLRKPDFLKRSGKFSKRWIKNAKTLSVLESNSDYEYLLSIFITNLRKEKKALGLLNESLAKGFNVMVSDIRELSAGTDDDFAHLEFSPLTDINEMKGYFVKEEDEPIAQKEEPSEDDNLRAISLMQKVFSHIKRDSKKGEEDVNVLMGNFSLFTNKDLDTIEELHKRNGNRTVIIHISQDKKSGEKFDFESIKTMKILTTIAEDNQNIIADARIVNVPLLSQVLIVLRPAFEPVSVTVNGSKEFLEIEYASRKWLNTEYPANVTFNKYSSGIEKIYKTLESGSVNEFSKLVPEIVSKYFMDYQSEYRKFIYVN
jgi:hypothetical protein